MEAGASLEAFAYDGNVIITVYLGRFAVALEYETLTLEPNDQVVIPVGLRIDLRCVDTGTTQIIWALGHAATKKIFVSTITE